MEILASFTPYDYAWLVYFMEGDINAFAKKEVFAYRNMTTIEGWNTPCMDCSDEVLFYCLMRYEPCVEELSMENFSNE